MISSTTNATSHIKPFKKEDEKKVWENFSLLRLRWDGDALLKKLPAQTFLLLLLAWMISLFKYLFCR